MEFRRALVIANPISGRGKARARAEALHAGLAERGLESELFLTSERGDAERRAAQLADADSACDVVFAVGGDGTVGEILSGLPPEIPLAIHPMGTANVLGTDLGLPRDVAGTLALLASPNRQALDVARVNGRLAFLVVGIGFDGAAVRDVEQRRRGPITKWTYVRSVLRTMRDWAPPELRVEIDGDPVPGTFGWVLVSNLIGYGGFLQLASDRELDDGRYEVFLFENATRLSLLRYALAGVSSGLPGAHARVVRARRVRVTAHPPVPYEVDGDFGGETPVDIEITDQHYQLLLPQPR